MGHIYGGLGPGGVWGGRPPPRIRDLYSKNFFEKFVLFTRTPLDKNRFIAPVYVVAQAHNEIHPNSIQLT